VQLHYNGHAAFVKGILILMDSSVTKATGYSINDADLISICSTLHHIQSESLPHFHSFWSRWGPSL